LIHLSNNNSKRGSSRSPRTAC